MKINLGCGDEILQGYINFDFRKTNPEVVVGDVRNLPFQDGYFDEIFAKDIYEHVSFLESENLIKHWVSKLKSGGKLVIVTTSLLDILEGFNSAIENQDTKLVKHYIIKLFGGQWYEGNFHYTVGYYPLISEMLVNSGIDKSNITVEHSVDVHPKTPNKINKTNMRIEAIKS